MNGNRKQVYLVEQSPLLADLPVYKNGAITGAFDCGYGVWQMLARCAAQADAKGYVDTLEAAGYRLLSVDRKGSNVFWQLGNGKKVLMVAYVPGRADSLRVIAESADTAVISGVKEEGYPTLCRSQVTQIGLGCFDDLPGDDLQPGDGVSMCYVIRLCDGSFIVYDGGMPWEDYADRLYTVLRAQTPDGHPIIIAAWVLTHAHPDHTGVFDLYAEGYTDKVKVETIVLNFGSDETEEDTRYQDHILNQTKKFAGARVMRVHVGTDLYFRNARLEVLFEPSLNAPAAPGNLNASTLVTRLELDGKSYMFLGDHADFPGNERYPSYTFNNGAIREIYGTYLKSDIVQVAHHGLGGGGTTPLYELTAAKYARWPIGEEKFLRHDLAHTGVNTYFLRDDVKTFYAFDRLQILYAEDGRLAWKEYDSFTDYEAQCAAAQP